MRHYSILYDNSLHQLDIMRACATNACLLLVALLLPAESYKSFTRTCPNLPKPLLLLLLAHLLTAEAAAAAAAAPTT
jgi:hypothetical protein